MGKLFKLIGLALVLFSSIAFADRVDIIESSTDMDYCSSTTAMFLAGADSRVHNFQRELKELRKQDVPLIEHGYDLLPKESMWVIGWDQMNEREQEFMRSKVFSGWDEANTILNKGATLNEEQLTGMAQIYFEGCMYLRTKERTIDKKNMSEVVPPIREYLNEIASSRRLVCEARSRNFFDKCMEWKE